MAALGHHPLRSEQAGVVGSGNRAGREVAKPAYRLDLVASFADETYDRFRNPFTNHKLADITKGHSDKVKVRLEPTRAEYEKLFGKPPPCILEAMKPISV